MSCDRARESLSSSIDDSLDPAEQAELEAHLQGCASCRATVADLRAIQEAAVGLGEEPLRRDGWAEVEARLRAGRGSRWSRPAIALIAAALLATIGATLLLRDDGTLPEREARRELARLEQQQQRTVQALAAVVERRSQAWDPSLRQIFARNAAVVDAALEECRRALGRRPADLGLRASLMEAYQRKLEFLKLLSGLEETP